MKLTRSQIFKVLAATLALIIILFAVRFFYFPKGFVQASSKEEAQFNLDRDWRPEMPDFLVTKLKNRYAKDEKYQNAMLQLGQALWMTLDPNGQLDDQRRRLERAMDCTYFRKVSHEDFTEIDEIVFFSNELVRRYLKWDRQLAGGVYPGRKESEADCD